MESLAAADLAALRTREQQLAFWINAYNILAIDLVAQHYPIASIRDIGSLLRPVWKRPAGRVGGRTVTLDEIEHEIVRPLGDPRTHAVVICASTSCPALPREPLTAERLDAQLDAAMRQWLADPGKGLRIDRAANTIHLSKIFDWFEEDFAKAGGVLAFVARYAPESDREWLRTHGATARIDYFDYDMADPGKGLRLERDANTVRVSKIFDWFEDDFAKAGGVLAFATRHAPESDREWLRTHGATAKLDYFDYDWAVNALAGKAER